MPAQRTAASLAPRFGAAQPESVPSPISIRVAARGVRRYWWLVLALWAVGSAGIGAVVYKKVQPQYRASSLLRVDPSSRGLYDGQSSENLDAFLLTQVQLITSSNVLTAAGTNPDAGRLPLIQTTGDVVLELRKAIQVGILPGTYLIEVAMTSPSAFEAATLVNAVVGAFNESNVEWSDGMTRNQIKSLEIYLSELKSQSTELERQWKDLVARGEGGQVLNNVAPQPKAGAKPGAPAEGMTTAQVSLSVEQYHRLQQEQTDLRIELAAVEAWLATARQVDQGLGSEAASPDQEGRIAAEVERLVADDPEIGAARAKAGAAFDQLSKIRRTARQGGDPAEKIADDKYKAAYAQFKGVLRARSRLHRGSIESPSGGAGSPAQKLHEMESKAQVLRVRKAVIEDEIKNLRVTNRKNATDEVEIILLRRHLDDIAAMQETVNRRLEEIRFQSKGENRVRTVQAAVAPGRPVSDRRMTYLAVTPVGILAAVLGLVVLLEIRSARVADPDLLSSRVRHEVFSIAPLPNIRPGEDANDNKAEQRLARFVQSLDHLRVALCEGGVPGEGRCVMITSATGGEGKTTLSAHLAARCANAGTSTLLIDADMRRASLGRLLDVPAGAGLGDVLAGVADLEEALITVQAGGFHFLSAGMPGHDPSRVLKSTRLGELIGRLRQTYDLIIIDTPPILPVADALVLGRWVDGAVVAARFDASRLPLVERANRQLAVAGIPVLGVVVNGVRGQDANYGNYAYSYNYPGRAVAPSGESPSA